MLAISSSPREVGIRRARPFRTAPLALLASLVSLALLVSESALAAPPGSVPGPVRVLDVADYRAYLADGHPARQGMRRFAALVGDTDPALRIRVRDDAVPGTPARQLAALKAGEAGAPALMLVAGTGLAAAVPAFGLLDLPFLVRDEAQADALLDGPFGAALLARLDKAGLVGLAWWENGFRQISSARGPILRAADLRGLRIRVIDEPVFADTMRALGADPLPLPFSQLRAALEAGRVDAQDNFLSQILAGRLAGVQSSLSLTNHSYGALVLVANAQAWHALSPASQRRLREAAVAAGREQRALARAGEDAARAELSRLGMTVHQPAADELDRMRQLTAPVRERAIHAQATELAPLLRAAGAGRP
ncbi:MAG: TRAP transporter substrate-binding protein [Lysobacteraceae bacterium]|nr:MAG: TRAP transporter substrate-binding protein [Xanthomonadaceae bacterium]